MRKNKIMDKPLIYLFVLAIFWGCSSTPKNQNAINSAGPALEASAAGEMVPEYRLGFGDVIEIKFFRNSQFDETVAIRPDGRISLAKVGELRVTGMTPAKLDTIITDAYREVLLDPEVTVMVREFGGYQVYVLGEVNAAGGFSVKPNMTLLQAIATAGGTKISAQLASVMVLRRGVNKGVDAIKVNLTKSVKGKHREDIVNNDILVQPQDIIYVPKTLISNVSDFMRQVYAGVLPPLDLYLRSIIIYDSI
ncbi:MAG TPA: polysaccharide biosynthesis/export family protein [bacterium]